MCQSGLGCDRHVDRTFIRALAQGATEVRDPRVSWHSDRHRSCNISRQLRHSETFRPCLASTSSEVCQLGLIPPPPLPIMSRDPFHHPKQAACRRCSQAGVAQVLGSGSSGKKSCSRLSLLRGALWQQTGLHCKALESLGSRTQ